VAFALRSARISVRDLVSEDEPGFLHWASEEEMYAYMAWRLATVDEARNEFRRLLNHPERAAAHRRHWYLAVVNRDAQFCGITGFDRRDDGTGEFGWYLAPPHWGSGYATAISALFLEFGFETLGLSAITASCDPDNAASRRVLEKSGLALAGEETVHTWRGPRPRLRFSVSASEWGQTERAGLRAGY
jgi:[ribosomal protein S5]-alanine N-acetyltransferase